MLIISGEYKARCGRDKLACPMVILKLLDKSFGVDH